ncbi:MAG: hypothetical protein L3J09_04255 [Flavobacteriaceae bacterium]|nr:hypothetical protein [Flavobacteriaceae bacterium]
MKRTLLFYIFTSIFITSFSQKPFDDPNDNEYLMTKTVNLKNAQQSVSGSPYFAEDFQRGIIFKKNIAIKKNVNLRYNASKDLFEIEFNQNQSKVLKQTEDIYVIINNKQFVYVPYSQNPDVNGYFEVLSDGKTISLYKKYNKKIREGKKSINSITSDIPPTYISKETLLLVNNDEFTELPKSKKGKIKSFANHHKELKNYIKDNSLNIKKESHLIKLITYYNTL